MPFLLQNSRNACHEMFQAGRKLRSSWRAIHGLRSWITWLFHGWFYMAGGVIILPCRKDFSANDLKIRGGCLVSITFLGSSHFHLWEISRHPFSKRNATDISCSQHDWKPYWHPSAWSKPSTRKWIKTWNTQPFCVEIIRTKKNTFDNIILFEQLEYITKATPKHSCLSFIFKNATCINPPQSSCTSLGTSASWLSASIASKKTRCLTGIPIYEMSIFSSRVV